MDEDFFELSIFVVRKKYFLINFFVTDIDEECLRITSLTRIESVKDQNIKFTFFA